MNVFRVHSRKLVVGPIKVRVAPTTGTTGRVALPQRDVALVTGFPAFTAKRMIAKLLTAEPDTKLFVLAREKFAPDAAQLLR